MKCSLVIAIMLSACAACPLNAGVVKLGAARDNTLYETIDGSLSNGAGQYCFVGVTAEPTIRRTLIAFDIESQVPPGATIVECSLTLHMSKTIAGSTDVTVHRVLQHWGEGDSDAPGEEGAGEPAAAGDATWIHTEYDTYYWSQRGGDFQPAPSATTSVGDDGWYTWGPGTGPDAGLEADAQAWLDGTAPNHGWLLAGDEQEIVTAKRFDTREHQIEQFRPALRVVYIPPCIADWNSDGAIDTRDVLAFLNEWTADERSADLDFSGDVDVVDMLEFLNQWNTGCP